MLQIALTLAIFLLAVIPAGTYMYHIAAGEKTFGDPFFDRVDQGIYRLCRIDRRGMGWKEYMGNLVLTNGVMILMGYFLLRFQGRLFLNPNGAAGLGPVLSLHTVISFMTNTNMQHSVGEEGLSHLSQMLVVIFMMFTSAATGYGACMALCRGFAGKREDVGNFYEDMVRVTTRLLLPGSQVIGLALVWQGVPCTFGGNVTVETVTGSFQDIALGPVAALESIKHLGTNGGGFFSANGASPLENPTIISNLLELFSMMLLPAACVLTFGKMVSKGKQGRAIFAAMAILFLAGLALCYGSEMAGNPRLAQAGLQGPGSYEGKEVRFGIDQSALFTAATSAFTTGSVNNMHSTLTPLGGMVPMLHMMMNCVFGGMGTGLMNMMMYVVLTVFICGLMVGRTPEYLGKKIEGREMRLVVLVLVLHPLLILGFSAAGAVLPAGMETLANRDFHGFSEILYEFSSAAANNGSGFEGLEDNTGFWNITTGIVMLLGRYVSLAAQLAVAGSLLAKRRVKASAGTMPTDNGLFTVLLVFIVYIFAGLTFVPALALGPVAEHLTLWF